MESLDLGVNLTIRQAIKSIPYLGQVNGVIGVNPDKVHILSQNILNIEVFDTQSAEVLPGTAKARWVCLQVRYKVSDREPATKAKGHLPLSSLGIVVAGDIPDIAYPVIILSGICDFNIVKDLSPYIHRHGGCPSLGVQLILR